MKINVLEYFAKGSLENLKNKVAVIDGEASYTFEELEIRSKKIASLIISKLKGTGCPVAVFLPRSVFVIIANLGILYSGNFYSNLDIKSPPQRIKNILDNIVPELVIASAQYFNTLIGIGINKSRIIFIEDIEKISFYSDELINKTLEVIVDTDPVCIINTSGSTGIPKSVVLSHRGIIDFMDWFFYRFKFGSDEIIGSLSPFYFDIYILELYYCLAKGATIVIIPEQLAIFPAKLVGFLDLQKVSFIFWVPTIMVNIANQGLLSKVKPLSLSKILFAGEVFPAKHLNYWRSFFNEAIFINLYGPIEITVDCVYYVIDRELADQESVPIGFPCRNTDIIILNENNELVKTNEQGELCVRGSSLAMGYWNNPERTSMAFVQNPLNKHYPEVVYRTGDLVYRNERNEIMFIGRKDFQIKHLGYRIELGEIEMALLSLDGILNCCVVYDARKKEINAFCETMMELESGDIRKKLLEKLPSYMLPKKFHFFDKLPMNPNGKIDRNKLQLVLKEGK